MSKVSLKQINKSFGKEPAVCQLNLDVKDGEFLVLLGPSGCGKSTTLNMIAGLEKQDSGSIYIDDVMVDHIAPNKRNIAMVFQSISLYPHLSVRENIAFPLKLEKVNADLIEEKVKEVSSLLKIGELLKRKPYELSGGQRQRVALGRAVVRNPKVFLFDEPLSSLDAKLKNEMRSEIKKLQKKLDATFIYVTHDQIEAMTLADKIVVMEKGEIQQIGTPNEIYKDPKNLMIASFLGNPSMNLVELEKIDNKKEGKFHAFGDNFKISFFESLNISEEFRKRIKYIGIRPEKMFVSDKLPTNEYLISEGTVSLIEPVGSDSYIDVQLNSNSENDVNINVKIRVVPDLKINISDKVFVFWSFEDTYFFDSDRNRIST